MELQEARVTFWLSRGEIRSELLYDLWGTDTCGHGRRSHNLSHSPVVSLARRDNGTDCVVPFWSGRRAVTGLRRSMFRSYPTDDTIGVHRRCGDCLCAVALIDFGGPAS